MSAVSCHIHPSYLEPVSAFFFFFPLIYIANRFQWNHVPHFPRFVTGAIDTMPIYVNQPHVKKSRPGRESNPEPPPRKARPSPPGRSLVVNDGKTTKKREGRFFAEFGRETSSFGLACPNGEGLISKKICVF